MKKPRCKRFASCLFAFGFLAAVLFHGGCGFIAHVGTPSEHEKKIAAEYDLTEHIDQKILVLVDQPIWLSAQVNLRYYLTEAISKGLIENVELAPEQLIDYNELSEFRSDRSDFSLLWPAEVGRALEADMVLLVEIGGYELNEMGGVEYYEGFLSARSSLFETATGERLWPESEKSRSIKVGFEIEPHGREAATARLTRALAHCLVRYLYNCPKNRFKNSDDRSSVGWKDW